MSSRNAGVRRGRAWSSMLAGLLACAAAVGLAGAALPQADSALFPGRLALDDGELFALGDPPRSGVLEDVAGRFELRFPSRWRTQRVTQGGHVAYVVSPDAGRLPPTRLAVGARAVAVRLADVFERQRWSAADALKFLLPTIQRSRPGMQLVEPVGPATLGGLEAATCAFAGERAGLPGRHFERVLIAQQDGTLLQLAWFSPEAQLDELRPTLDAIAADSRFGRAGAPRPERSLEPRTLVERYRGSIVSVLASDARGASSGTGFLVSREGYIVTNYHVAFDVAARRPMERLTVEWDESLRRASVEAQLIGGRFRLSPFEHQHGVDVALLKIPPGDYAPLPLSPLAEVRPGDGVVTLGFPSRGVLEGLSLTVTSGVVARFNRRPTGEVDSVFVDAAFTHGSSGGPCLSLVTGGVIGLTTFGTDVVLDPRFQRLNDLIDYKGVVPIDAALREFPLECDPQLGAKAAELDFLDSYALSKHFLATGSLAAAERIALRGVELEPRQPLAHVRLGEARLARALDARSEGDAERADKLFATARKAFGQALQRDAVNAVALEACAGLELELGRADAAAAFAERSVAADSERWQAQLLLADLRARQGRFDAALKHVDAAKVVAGGVLVNPHVTAAQIHTARGDFESARREWAEAVRISPVYLPARLGVADCLERSGHPDQALAEYRGALADFRDDPEVQGRIALCLDRSGRAAEALEWFSRALQRSLQLHRVPEEQVVLRFADALLASGRDVDAIPVLALHQFHASGAAAATTSLRLAEIHARHQALGLASAHARLAQRDGGDPQLAAQAERFARAPLSLQELRYMLQFQYPERLICALVGCSTLGFAIESEQQLGELRASGVPDAVLQAVLGALSQPPQDGAPPPAGGPGPDLRGTWIADGTLGDGAPFRCLVIFGELGLFTADTFVNFGSLGMMRGQYSCDGTQLVLSTDDGRRYVSPLQLSGGTLVMDMPEFAGGLRFQRQP